MRSFVITLLSVAFLNGAIGMISPDGDMRKYVRFTGALCILAAIVSPLYFAINSGALNFCEDFFEQSLDETLYESEYESALLEAGENSLAEAVKKSLITELGMNEKSFGVRVVIASDDGDYRIDAVEIALYSSAVNTDPRDISAFVCDKTGGECRIIYEIG